MATSERPNPPRAWYLGNTTVRSPLRLRAGLIALGQSPMQGSLGGHANEQALARLLDAAGVVSVFRLEEDEEMGRVEETDASDVGRKWRAAMTQLGFLTPAQDVLDRIGSDREPFTITEAGQRLINAEPVVAQQECFLRALLAHQVPSPLENFPEPVFSPLRVVLETLRELEAKGHGKYIHKDELIVVELVRRVEDVPEAVREIASYRAQISTRETKADKTQFRNRFREQHRTERQTGNTLKDYADSNFRYLKATGLFLDRNSRLVIAPQKATMVQLILAIPYAPFSEHDYPETLWHGADLPTDRKEEAQEAIASLTHLLGGVGAPASVPELAPLAVAELSQVRHRLEQSYANILEARWAERQAEELPDIEMYLHALTQRNDRRVPHGEAPAYLEWALWRAFLAIDSLRNAAWEARQFQIDPTDFRPVGTAPAGRPDMIFEFDDWVVVVEVTLLGGSRQEAAEGEPVRRHVADIVQQYPMKPVYGLFIANVIDTNTVETFRQGVWFTSSDERLEIEILPLTLSQFAALFPLLFGPDGRIPHRIVREVVEHCIARKNGDGLVWKQAIAQEIEGHIIRLNRLTA